MGGSLSGRLDYLDGNLFRTLGRDIVFPGGDGGAVVFSLGVFREVVGEGVKVGLPHFFLSGGGINHIGDDQLIELGRIGASLNPVVVGTGFDSDNISDDAVIEVDIHNLFAEIVLDEVG